MNAHDPEFEEVHVAVAVGQGLMVLYPASTLFNEVMAKVGFALDFELIRTAKWIDRA